MAVFIEPIGTLMNEFSKLPGVGSKTAQRYAYRVINMTEEEALAFAEAIMKFLKIALSGVISIFNKFS